jgi:NADH-quinone oxidoreductase subunit A
MPPLLCTGAGMLTNYLPILIFLVIATALAGLMLGTGKFLGRLGARHRGDSEKLSPFEDSRVKFDVRYYLVAILFIIFDLEIAFLFPWAVSLGRIGVYGLGAMGLFLLVLIVGFAYEWKKGALEWD